MSNKPGMTVLCSDSINQRVGREEQSDKRLQQQGEQDKAIDMGRYGVHHNTKEIIYSIRKRTDNRTSERGSQEAKIMRRIARKINGSEGTSKIIRTKTARVTREHGKTNSTVVSRLTG